MDRVVFMYTCKCVISCNVVRRKLLNYKYMNKVLVIRMYACNCVVSCIFVRLKILNYIKEEVICRETPGK